MEEQIYESLKQLRQGIPRLAEVLKLKKSAELSAWTQIMDAKLLARLSPGFPVIAAICGGGSSGKSTLFNSLLGERLAPTGGRAGMNRRLLFSVSADRMEPDGLIAELTQPFKSSLEPLTDPQDLTIPGNPLYVASHGVSDNLILVDTPDFDTGAKGQYTNREITQIALDACDVLIYVFTNSNYNNRDNTDFIARMLTGIGRRKCFLIYRVYPNFTEQEVHEHAMTVGRGIYGDEAEKYILGIYRADEDNQVAAGQKFMQFRSVRSKDPTLLEALVSIDASRLRYQLYASILNDVLKQSAEFVDCARLGQDELHLYRDGLQVGQSACVHEALKQFPMDRVMGRFAQIWAASDPAHVKVMRKTGSLIEFPFKLFIGVAGWAKDRLSPEKTETSSAADFTEKVDEDLISAVNSLHYLVLSPQISVTASLNDPVAKRMQKTVDGIRARKGLSTKRNPRVEASVDGAALSFYVDTHPVVFSAQKKLRRRDFQSVLQSILAHKDMIIGISEDMDADLKELADYFRSKMGLWGKISQTFWALLNVLPATVAITYVLSTGDPVGATGIKVKLTGLFGAHDLYALFAIPATTGLKKADQKQLESLLGPIVQTWLDHKLKTVQQLFDQKISGTFLQITQETLNEADQRIKEIENCMNICTQAIAAK